MKRSTNTMSSSLPQSSHTNNDDQEEAERRDEGVETTALTPPNGAPPHRATHRNPPALSYPDMEYAMHSFYTIVQPGMFLFSIFYIHFYW
jgi:hypothetical protein